MIEKSFREREKEQAEKTTHLRCRHDGERKDEQEREERGRILSLQAKGWRKEETESKTVDKRQRTDQDSWSHPRR